MVLTGVGPWQVIAGYTTYPAPGYQYQWPGGAQPESPRETAGPDASSTRRGSGHIGEDRMHRVQ